MLASGGVGQLFAVTTNPPQARGQGIAIAARAGAVIADPEFVQFHPTAIAGSRDPAPLVTEALRGEGAILIDGQGRRFMPAVHPDAELGPRDVVARAIHREIAAGRSVYLDTRAVLGARLPEAFPTVYENCISMGIDPIRDPIPVAPAAHYHMGGIKVDAAGRASLAGLWACGEVSSTGAHGANRLASNSLLEAVVYGARIAEDIAGASLAAAAETFAPVELVSATAMPPLLVTQLRQTMTAFRRRHPQSRRPRSRAGRDRTASARGRADKSFRQHRHHRQAHRGGRIGARGKPGRTFPQRLPGTARSLAAPDVPHACRCGTHFR